MATRKPARKKASPTKAAERGVSAAHRVYLDFLAKADPDAPELKQPAKKR